MDFFKISGISFVPLYLKNEAKQFNIWPDYIGALIGVAIIALLTQLFDFMGLGAALAVYGAGGLYYYSTHK